jgi:thiol-disulfide isomerase/thioredoxin
MKQITVLLMAALVAVFVMARNQGEGSITAALDGGITGDSASEDSVISALSEGGQMTTAQKTDKTRFRIAPEVRSTTWLNGTPTSLAELRGQVVLVDFWTFDCINCQHVMPALKGWNLKYADRGLTIIGIHSPEFDFERQEGNVEHAIKEFGLPYRVALDNDFQNWNAYHNRYWPSLYLIDREGFIRLNQIGEGNYDQVEAAIEQLLSES